jgi:hypothetical protein
VGSNEKEPTMVVLPVWCCRPLPLFLESEQIASFCGFGFWESSEAVSEDGCAE